MGIRVTKPSVTSVELQHVQFVVRKAVNDSQFTETYRLETFALEASRWVHTGHPRAVEPWQRGVAVFLDAKSAGGLSVSSRKLWNAFHRPSLSYAGCRGAVKAWPDIWPKPSTELRDGLRSLDVCGVESWAIVLACMIGKLAWVALQNDMEQLLSVAFEKQLKKIDRKFNLATHLVGAPWPSVEKEWLFQAARPFLSGAVAVVVQDCAHTVFGGHSESLGPLQRPRRIELLGKPPEPTSTVVSKPPAACVVSCSSVLQCPKWAKTDEMQMVMPSSTAPAVVEGVSLENLQWREISALSCSRTFYMRKDFPDIYTLAEQLADELADEFEALWSNHRAKFRPWKEDDKPVPGWLLFGTHLFGYRLETNCSLAPKATALAERIPGTTMCGYSILMPGTQIDPHREHGDSAGTRLHVGLRIPRGGCCGLCVDGHVRIWARGAALLFDPTCQHHAWNFCNELRAVLLLDFGASSLPFDHWPHWLQDEVSG
eukprot:gnl/TRDRNA2_/TRDRNA2_42211_c0_seq1.p1 gnl/TRDRNA2_/TRDRNA2_42211_c0~~gnl/TRDRNA2_/TRDRNA2_42211_c0_seq1.p1  ORF type:complete len:485 (+),score=35.97 gnl/TRDRNA2_/TRDRNA2_42211_c0_seq1:47-1501(+)